MSVFPCSIFNMDSSPLSLFRESHLEIIRNRGGLFSVNGAGNYFRMIHRRINGFSCFLFTGNDRLFLFGGLIFIVEGVYQ